MTLFHKKESRSRIVRKYEWCNNDGDISNGSPFVGVLFLRNDELSAFRKERLLNMTIILGASWRGWQILGEMKKRRGRKKKTFLS